MHSINLAEKLSTFAEYWQPRVVGQFNGHDRLSFGGRLTSQRQSFGPY